MKPAVNGLRRIAPWAAIVVMVMLAGAAGAIRLGAAEQQVRTNAAQIEDGRKTGRSIMVVLAALQAQQERIDERTRAIQDEQTRQLRLIETILAETRGGP